MVLNTFFTLEALREVKKKKDAGLRKGFEFNFKVSKVGPEYQYFLKASQLIPLAAKAEALCLVVLMCSQA